MRRFVRPIPVLTLVLLAAAACARGVDFDPEPGQSYAINVTNELAEPMIVSFDDGSGERLLGTVAAGATDRFIIAGAAAMTVSVIAHDEARTRTVRRTITLRPGSSVDVRLN